MDLYFMRHAEAEDTAPGRSDAERQLTEKGIRRSREAGTALRALGVELDLILTSPLARALQTADIVAEIMGTPVEPAAAIAGPLTLSDLRDLLEEHSLPGRVMLVGHEPDFSALVGELIGGADVEMKKGAVAGLDCRAIVRGGARLRWLIVGRQLSLITAGSGAES